MELETNIDIQASPEAVWKVLTDFEHYGDWNPFIEEMRGEAAAGERLEVRMTPPDSRAMTFKPIVTRAVPEQELRWRGRLWVPGLFDGEHSFEIDRSTDRSVRFTQRETFSGLLVPLLARYLKTKTRRGFEQMNQALKERVEQLADP
jgi:hypothetical protein